MLHRIVYMWLVFISLSTISRRLLVEIRGIFTELWPLITYASPSKSESRVTQIQHFYAFFIYPLNYNDYKCWCHAEFLLFAGLWRPKSALFSKCFMLIYLNKMEHFVYKTFLVCFSACRYCININCIGRSSRTQSHITLVLSKSSCSQKSD